MNLKRLHWNITRMECKGVPEYVYNELMDASSKGHYLATYVKGHYPYSKIG